MFLLHATAVGIQDLAFLGRQARLALSVSLEQYLIASIIQLVVFYGRISAAFPEAKYAAVNIDSQQGTSKERESWAIEVQLRGVDLQNASAVALDTGHAKCEIIQSDRVPPIP